jgi:hypothetical protein
MLNSPRVAAALLAAIFLASCSSSGSAPPISNVPVGAAASSRPNLFSDYITIRFHNKSQYAMQVTTYWSYPLFPHWTKSSVGCVLFDEDWQSEIGFTYPDGQVKMLVERHGDSCNLKGTPFSAVLHFKSIDFSKERATISSEADWDRDSSEFCGRQTYPDIDKRECTKFSSHKL